MRNTRVIVPLVLITVILALIVYPVLTGSKKGNPDAPEKEVLRNAAIVATSPEQLKGQPVAVAGEVADDPQYDGDGTHFQLFIRSGGDTANMVVDYPVNLELTEGDFIMVRGRIKGIFIGADEDGSQVELPRAMANTIRDVTPQSVLAPAKSIWKTQKRGSLRGVEVRLRQVDFAAQETRLYLTVRNQSNSPIVIQVFNTEIVQSDKIFRHKTAPSRYKSVPIDLEVGASGAGVMVFDPLDSAKPLRLSLRLAGVDWEDSVDFSVMPPASSD